MLLIVPLLLLFFPVYVSSLAVPDGTSPLCSSYEVVSEMLIGKDKNVQMELRRCVGGSLGGHQVNQPAPVGLTPLSPMVNLCYEKCDTRCLTPGDVIGPDPNHCSVISQTILDAARNGNGLIDVPPNMALAIRYLSCMTAVQNLMNTPLQYCQEKWAPIVNTTAFNCQAPRGHGGQCVPSNPRWVIRVERNTN